MFGLWSEGDYRWRPHFLPLVWTLLLAAPPLLAVGSFLGDTKAVLNGCEDQWTLQGAVVVPRLFQMTVCVDVHVVVPGAWAAFLYTSVRGPNPDLGLEGDATAIYGWLLQVRHRFPLQLTPLQWHRLCLRRDAQGNSFSLEVDGRMVAERTVIAQAIPPSGTLWLGCRPQMQPPGAQLGKVELYLFRMWADLNDHGLCEDGSIIGWNSWFWSVTGPKAKEKDPYLLCEKKRFRREAGIDPSPGIPTGPGMPREFSRDADFMPSPLDLSPTVRRTSPPISSAATHPSSRAVSGPAQSGDDSPVLRCDTRQLCSNDSSYFWVSVTAEDDFDDGLWDQVSRAFSCGSAITQQPQSFRQFCQNGGNVQVVEVSCSNTTVSTTTCGMLLLLNGTVSACDLELIGKSALRLSNNSIQVERVGRNLCEGLSPSEGRFVTCSSTSSLEDICRSNAHSNIICSVLKSDFQPVSGHGSSSCSAPTPNFCDCTASCSSTTPFYAMKLNISDKGFTVETLKLMFLQPSLGLSCKANNLCDIVKKYEAVRLECHGMSERLYSCMVIVEMSGPVDECALRQSVQDILKNNPHVQIDKPLTRMMVCGSAGSDLKGLLESNLTWVVSDLHPSDMCRTEPTLPLCDPGETLAVLLTDICPSQPLATQPQSQSSTTLKPTMGLNNTTSTQPTTLSGRLTTKDLSTLQVLLKNTSSTTEQNSVLNITPLPLPHTLTTNEDLTKNPNHKTITQPTVEHHNQSQTFVGENANTTDANSHWTVENRSTYTTTGPFVSQSHTTQTIPPLDNNYTTENNDLTTETSNTSAQQTADINKHTTKGNSTTQANNYLVHTTATPSNNYTSQSNSKGSNSTSYDVMSNKDNTTHNINTTPYSTTTSYYDITSSTTHSNNGNTLFYSTTTSNYDKTTLEPSSTQSNTNNAVYTTTSSRGESTTVNNKTSHNTMPNNINTTLHSTNTSNNTTFSDKTQHNNTTVNGATTPINNHTTTYTTNLRNNNTTNATTKSNSPSGVAGTTIINDVTVVTHPTVTNNYTTTQTSPGVTETTTSAFDPLDRYTDSQQSPSAQVPFNRTDMYNKNDSYTTNSPFTTQNKNMLSEPTNPPPLYKSTPENNDTTIHNAPTFDVITAHTTADPETIATQNHTTLHMFTNHSNKSAEHNNSVTAEAGSGSLSSTAIYTDSQQMINNHTQEYNKDGETSNYTTTSQMTSPNNKTDQNYTPYNTTFDSYTTIKNVTTTDISITTSQISAMTHNTTTLISNYTTPDSHSSINYNLTTETNTTTVRNSYTAGYSSTTDNSDTTQYDTKPSNNFATNTAMLRSRYTTMKSTTSSSDNTTSDLETTTIQNYTIPHNFTSVSNISVQYNNFVETETTTTLKPTTSYTNSQHTLVSADYTQDYNDSRETSNYTTNPKTTNSGNTLNIDTTTLQNYTIPHNFSHVDNKSLSYNISETTETTSTTLIPTTSHTDSQYTTDYTPEYNRSKGISNYTTPHSTTPRGNNTTSDSDKTTIQNNTTFYNFSNKSLLYTSGTTETLSTTLTPTTSHTDSQHNPDYTQGYNESRGSSNYTTVNSFTTKNYPLQNNFSTPMNSYETVKDTTQRQDRTTNGTTTIYSNFTTPTTLINKSYDDTTKTNTNDTTRSSNTTPYVTTHSILTSSINTTLLGQSSSTHRTTIPSNNYTTVYNTLTTSYNRPTTYETTQNKSYFTVNNTTTANSNPEAMHNATVSNSNTTNNTITPGSNGTEVDSLLTTSTTHNTTPSTTYKTLKNTTFSTSDDITTDNKDITDRSYTTPAPALTAVCPNNTTCNTTVAPISAPQNVTNTVSMNTNVSAATQTPETMLTEKPGVENLMSNYTTKSTDTITVNTNMHLTTKGGSIHNTTTVAVNPTTTTTTNRGSIHNTTTVAVNAPITTTTTDTPAKATTTTTKAVNANAVTTTQTSTTTSKAETQLNNLSNLTKEASQLNSSQISHVVKILDTVLQGPNVSKASGKKVLDVINNLLDADESALSGSANSLIRMVEKLGLLLEVTGDTETISATSLVLAVRTVDSTNFVQTSVDIYSPNNVQLSPSSTRRKRSASLVSSGSLPSSLKSASPLGSVSLPTSLLSGLSPEERQNASRVQFTFYSKNSLFQDISLNNQTNVSQILGSSVANLTISNLKNPIRFSIRNPGEQQINPEVTNATCVFWDYALNDEKGGWRTDGCSVVNVTSTHTTCSCNHLTSFAVLLDLSREGIKDRQQAEILTFITYIGCGISSIFLSFTVLTYLLFPKILRDIPAKILVQLSFSLLLLNLVFLLDSWLSQFNAVGLCISTAFVLHYFLLTSFTWAGLEALHMYLSIVRVFTPYLNKYMLKFSLMGWGIPLVVVIVVIAVDKNNYGRVGYDKYTNASDFCWLRNDIAFYVAVVAYFLLVFILCLLVFIVVMRQLSRIKKQNPHNQAPNRSMVTDMRSIMGLVLLLGLTWGFALFAWGPLYLPFVYLFSIFNSLQGFFLFVFHCAVKENVRRQWRIYLCCGKLRLPENQDWSRTATNNKKTISNATGTTSNPMSTSRSSVASDVTNSSRTARADSGISSGISGSISSGSNIDVLLNEIHATNVDLQSEA